MTSTSKYLATYLNDHLGGATAGVELVRRAARENEGSELGVKADRAKVAAGWAAEKMGRLKPNAQLRGYSPLSPLVELEGLLVGIQGKLGLWRALAEIADAVGLDRARLDELAARAESQQADLERHRIDVARRALTAV